MTQENRRVDNEPTEALIKELEERAKYYYKGFGMLLSSILGNSELFSNGINKEETGHFVIESLNKILDCYNDIPFDSLSNFRDNDILIAVKTLLDKLKLEVQSILKGKKDLDEAERLIISIIDKGNEYRQRLAELYKKVRQQPGFEHYALTATDIITDKKVILGTAL